MSYENQITPVDLSEYSQAKSAAKAARDTIREIAEGIGQSPDIEVTLKEEDGSYVLYWEGGPADWATRMVHEESGLIGGNINGVAKCDSSMWIEAKYSFALEFGNY